ncbi:Endonuclease-reverse transcriptase [Popillia japonica]|uniref:Endonuclease-reverse transcriptase n=1 Tax=Popillia japonica TaxID=7064 RepID=A0AAW1LA58_POPJA
MAYTVACEKNIDVIIIGEPNKKLAKDHNLITDYKLNVAVHVTNKNIGIIGHTVGDGYVCLMWKKWCLYGCYCSPNISFKEFKTYTDTVLQDVNSRGTDAIVAGDFNSKAQKWGSPLRTREGNISWNGRQN